MGAHGDGVQTAVVLVLAVVGAVAHSALDALVGRAGTAAVGGILHHNIFLLRTWIWRFAGGSLCGNGESMCNRFEKREARW